MHVNWSGFDIEAIPLWAGPGPSPLHSAHPHHPGPESLLEVLQNANIPESGEEVDNERVMKNTEKICKELVWYVGALNSHASQNGPCPT